MKKRIAVAMSGGVDSSVAAALLQKQGHEVIGMTMCFNLPGSKSKKPNCCGLEGIEDARRIAHKLGIKHYVLNMQKALEKQVINDFCREYSLGKTPNPCVRCNQYIKFDALLAKALAAGASYLATGHYARIAQGKEGFYLKKALDARKDQSYFLYRLNQNQLKHIKFPLGGLTKVEVRKLAHEFGLAVADRVASQEICFLPEDNYRLFLERRIPEAIKPGTVVDTKGNILGLHPGIAFYTIGQRQGLGIACGYPAYVAKIDAGGKKITLGKKEDVMAREFLVQDICFSVKPIKKKVALRVKIRYNHPEALAEVTPCKDKLRIKFKKPQFAITPGQSAVFYNRDTVIGGGIIDKVK